MMIAGYHTQHIATTINTPSLFAAIGCQYHISPDDMEVIENLRVNYIFARSVN